MAIKVLLADDHTVLRDGLRALLQAEGDLAVVASVADGRLAIQEARRLQPDVALLDIAMPELNGIDAAGQLIAESPATRVVILSIHASPEHIYRAFRAGVTGYLLKESAGVEVVAAIRAAHAGQRYLSQRIADTVLDGYLLDRSQTGGRSPLDELSLREREVLQLVVEGRSTAEIAGLLNLSPRTVETYRSRLMAKLGLYDLPSLTKFALQHGLTSLQ